MTELYTGGLFGDDTYAKGAALMRDMKQQKAALQAGNAYANGDYAGASGVLARSGNIDGARTLDTDIAGRAATARKTQEDDRSHAITAMLNMAQGLRRVPQNDRQHAFDTVIAPLLKQQGMDDAHIQQMAQGSKDDQSIDATIQALGGELQKLQVVNLGRGGVGTVDAYSNTYKELRAPDQTAAPQGYTWGPNDTLVAIPGGPADPATVGTLSDKRAAASAAHRAPPRGRAGGKVKLPGKVIPLGPELDANDGW